MNEPASNRPSVERVLPGVPGTGCAVAVALRAIWRPVQTPVA